MSRFADEDERVAIQLATCECDGTPHTGGDTVWLRPRLDAAGGFAIIGIVSTQDDRPLAERLGRAYLTHGIEDWTFTGPNGAKVPVTPRNIARLAWSEQVLEIANAAADLYSEAVLGPLVAKASESSPSGQSDDSTSPTSDSGD